MATKILKTKFQIRQDTAANWTSKNPTLAPGEIAFDTTNRKFKIGNGSTSWNSLAYAPNLTKDDITTALGYTPPTKDTTYKAATVSAAGLMSAADKSKLDNIAAGAEVNVQSDWNATSGDAYIKNKPSVYNKSQIDSLLAGMHETLENKASTSHSHDIATSSKLGFVKSATTGTTANRDYNVQIKSDGTMKVNVPWLAYTDATQSKSGLMNASDKTKLDGITAEATRVTTETVAGWGYTKNAGTVTSVKIGSTSYSPSSGIVSLPSYPTSLPASDVYSWAKASTKPTYTASEVGLGNVGNFKAVSTVASQGLSATEKSNARANIGAGTSSFSGSYTDLSNKPDLSQYVTTTTYNSKINEFDQNFSSISQELNDMVTHDIKVGSTTYYPSNGVVSLPAYPTSLKNPTSLSFKANSDTTAFASYDGSVAKTITIKPAESNGSFLIGVGGTFQKITLNGSFTDTIYTHPSTHAASMITGLATVAKTGSYSDLSNKPDIPSGAAASKGVDTSISASSTSTNLPTSKAVAAFVEGKGYKTTDNNTTYTVATGDSNGQIKITPSSGSAYNVSIKGLGSAAYTDSTAYAAASHGTHVSYGGNGSAATVSRSDHTHDYSSTYAPKSHSHTGYATSSHDHDDKYVKKIKVGSHEAYSIDGSGIISLPAYPTSLPASDVYSWAKASTKPTYTKSDVGLGNVGNFKAVSTVASQGLTDTEKSNARANIGAGTSNLTLGTTSTTAAKGDHTHSGMATQTWVTNQGYTKLTIGTTSSTAAAGNHTHSGYATSGHSHSGYDILGDGGGDDYVLISQLDCDPVWVEPAYLGLATTAWVNSQGYSKLAIGTTATTAAAGNHTHSGYAASTHDHDARYVQKIKIGSSEAYQIDGSGVVQLPAYPTGGTGEDAKTTSGSKTGAKQFIVTATSQSTSGITTYSHPGFYIDASNRLYAPYGTTGSTGYPVVINYTSSSYGTSYGNIYGIKAISQSNYTSASKNSNILYFVI